MKSIKVNLRAKEAQNLDDDFIKWLPEDDTEDDIGFLSKRKHSDDEIIPIRATGSIDLYVLSKVKFCNTY